MYLFKSLKYSKMYKEVLQVLIFYVLDTLSINNLLAKEGEKYIINRGIT